MAGRYKYLTDNNLTLKAIWAWAKQLVQDLNKNDSSSGDVPAGAQMWWGAVEAPLGWLICDGSTYSKAAYPALFLNVGYAFGGSGDNFLVPDYRDRILMGAGTLVALGAQAGAAEVALTEANLAAHDHGVTDPGHTHAFTGAPHTHTVTDPGHNHTGGVAGNMTSAAAGAAAGFDAASTGTATTGLTVNSATAGGTNANAMTGLTVNSAGSGEAFSILNPVFGVNVIIKY